jgi:CheY-like chemotaxis protein
LLLSTKDFSVNEGNEMNLKGKSILVVDDDAEVVSVIQHALESRGATVSQASDGVEAAEVAEQVHPDLVVLDMMLPKRGGMLVLERLKKPKPDSKVPYVVMITANEGARHRAFAESLGVDGYINKPFRLSRLIAVVEELLGDQSKKT